MKFQNKLLLTLCLVTFLTANIFSCKKDQEKSRIVTLTIASELVAGGPNPPANANNPAIVYRMSITEDGSNEKYYLDQTEIEGFTFENGYTYKLKVRKSPISEPMADGPITSYALVELISKIKAP